MTNPELSPVLSAVAAYKVKQLDVELLAESMHNCPEKHPKRVLRMNRLAIELADDLRAIGKLIIDMEVRDERENIKRKGWWDYISNFGCCVVRALCLE